MSKEELMNKYNDELKCCKTVNEVQELVKNFYNDVEIWNKYNGDLRTKNGHNSINSFFQTFNPKKIEYICDSDDRTRCCKIENLYRFVKFEIR